MARSCLPVEREGTEYLAFEGRQLAYRVSGAGPPLVILSQYWRSASEVLATALSQDWQVFQTTPIGYGLSDRVSGFAGARTTEQVLAVLDQHDTDGFVASGYSAGGAMAAGVVCSTDRAVGLVCGGFALVPARPGVVRQLDRRLPPDHPSREQWAWIASFNWPEDLANLSIPRLLYWGSEDRQMAKPLRRLREELILHDTDFVELAGYDHGGCSSERALTNDVAPTIRRWAADHGLIGGD